MNNTENMTSVLEAMASNPRVATIVAASTTAAGAASSVEILQGWLSVASMTVGIFTGLVVLTIQMIRLERAWRERRLLSKEAA